MKPVSRVSRYKAKPAALLLALALCGSAVAAEFSRWQFDVSTTPKGTALCSLMAVGTDAQVARNLAVKMFAGKQSLNITLYKASWQAPQGTNIPLKLDFFDEQPLQLLAYGDGKVADIELPVDATAIFLGLMSSEKAMRLSFDRGNEPPWVVSLAGVRPKLKQFVDCSKRLTTRPY